MLSPKKSSKEKVKLSKESIAKSKHIFRYLKPYSFVFGVGWVFLILSTSAGLMFPILMGQLLGSNSDKVNSSDAIQLIANSDINHVALGLFILFGFQALFSFFRVVIFTNVTENVLKDIRKDAFSRLVYMPMDFFNKNKVGELSSRLSSDITQVQETLRTTIAEFFRQLVMIVGGIIFLMLISWKLALIMLSTVPIMAIVAVFFGKYIKKLARIAQDETAQSNAVVEESLTGISNVKSFTNEVFAINKYLKSVDKIRKLNVKSGLWRGVFASFIIFCLFGAIVFIIWQGMLMTQGVNPELSFSDFYTFIFYTIMMGASVGSMPELYASIQKAVGSTENLMNIIEDQSEKELMKGNLKPQLTGKVEFKNITFTYPQRPDVEVLKGISFFAEANETVALVGSSGAGKSTIASLVLRYFEINSGEILFDGVRIQDVDIENLRSAIALVPQEVILISGSIFENIAFGNPKASNDEVVEAAKKANAFDFINSFPDGMETQVGDRGIQLSGGQRQRIAIARALLKNPRILILDEATSALDSESEKLVQDALEKLMVGRTSIVIAHRLSTIRKADKIFVIDQGKVVENGNHESLIAIENGKYANLIKLQNNN